MKASATPRESASAALGMGSPLAGGRVIFSTTPLAAITLEIEENPVAPGFAVGEFERPAGAGVEFEFADLADTIRLAQAQRRGGELPEALGGFGVERLVAEQAGKGGEVTVFKGFGDLLDEFLGVGGGQADSEVFKDGFRVFGRGGAAGIRRVRDFNGLRLGLGSRSGRGGGVRHGLGAHSRAQDQQHQRSHGQHGGESEEKVGKFGALHGRW
jgi:hypothetical protein